MTEFLVGSTGFVGSNLSSLHGFDGLFHSTNIDKAYGCKPDLLVYSGVKAEMFLANRDPLADKRQIDNAIDNIKLIDPKECILISTIAVYPDTHGADEDSIINPIHLPAYGANRLYLERWVEENVENHLIVRLPAIYGRNLKKNFIFDFINIIPSLLTLNKFNELLSKAPQLAEYYDDQGNGFFKCKELKKEERALLKQIYSEVGFSALNFSDSRSEYQFYSLKHLWNHIEIARDHNLKKINITTPPVSVATVFSHLTGKEFTNYLSKPPFAYDLHSKYADLYGGSNGYLMGLEQELNDIAEFVREESDTLRVDLT